MSDQIANSFELSESILLNFAKGTIDLTDSFAGINIKEDLFKPSLECVLEIIDGTNSLGIVDFDGTETFKIAFKSLRDDDEEINLTFRIYKVHVQLSEVKSDIKVYQLFAVTPEHYTQAIMDINQSFTVPVEEAVESVFGKLGTNRKLETHKTSGIYTYIIPGMTPFETFEFLKRRAYDSKFRSSLFTFYEDADGYHFKNVEKLIKDNRKDAIPYRFVPNASFTTDDDLLKNIEKLEISANKDVMQKIKSGAYANAAKEIDLINQKVNVSTCQIREDFVTFEHLDDAAMSLDSKAIIDESLNIINSTQWLNKTSEETDNRATLIPRRKFYFDCLSQVETRIVVPGNSNLRVGKVVDLDILELAANEDKEQEPKVSGKYLITRLAHTLDRGTYRCSMILNKESYNANVEDLSKNIVVKQ